MEKLTNFDIFYGSMFFLIILMVLSMPLFYLTAFIFESLKDKIYNIYRLYTKTFYILLFFVCVLVGVNHL